MKRAFVSAVAILIAVTSAAEASSQKKDLFISPKAGVWTVTAVDEENTNWSGRLYLVRRAARRMNVRYSGQFYWRSADGAGIGREYFSGRFNRLTGKLVLRGHRITSIKGDLARGHYTASLSRGRRIFNGSWSGEESVPGKWSARWLRPR